MNPLKLFRQGHDYVEIGNVLGIHEAQVEKLIHFLRGQEIERRDKANARVREQLLEIKGALA